MNTSINQTITDDPFRLGPLLRDLMAWSDTARDGRYVHSCIEDAFRQCQREPYDITRWCALAIDALDAGMRSFRIDSPLEPFGRLVFSVVQIIADFMSTPAIYGVAPAWAVRSTLDALDTDTDHDEVRRRMHFLAIAYHAIAAARTLATPDATVADFLRGRFEAMKLEVL